MRTAQQQQQQTGPQGRARQQLDRPGLRRLHANTLLYRQADDAESRNIKLARGSAPPRRPARQQRRTSTGRCQPGSMMEAAAAS